MKFGLRPKFGLNYSLRPKLRPNTCCHLNILSKLCLRPKFGLRTKSDLFLSSHPLNQLSVHLFLHVSSTSYYYLPLSYCSILQFL